MNQSTIEFIEMMLKTDSEGDRRGTVLSLLKGGAAIGKLDQAVELVCRRLKLRRNPVLEWFSHKLEVMTEDTKRQIERIYTWENQRTSTKGSYGL